MAEATVKLHLTTVFRVLGVQNRTQAALLVAGLNHTHPAQPLTDVAILEEFANTVLASKPETMAGKVISFGKAIERRINAIQ